MESDILILVAGPEHIGVVHGIMLECVDANPRKEFFVDSDVEFFERHIAEEGFTLLAVADGVIAGFLVIDIPGEDNRNLGRDLGWPRSVLLRCAHTDTVCVRPANRGRGLQKLLAREAELRLVDMGIERCLATIHPENVASLSSMLSLGYRIAATKPKYGGLPRHILVKNLVEEL